jgi:putative membrane protein
MNPGSVLSYAMNYCGTPAGPAELWNRWNFDPLLLVALSASACLGALLLKNASGARRGAFGLAWIIAAVLFVSPICALTVSLLSARVIHHVILMVVVAPLLVLALPSHWRAPPVVLPGVIMSAIALWIWHAPDVYVLSFLSPVWYWLMQASLLATACLLWWGFLRAPSALAACGAALASAIQMGLLGALLAFAKEPLYLPHFQTPEAFGLSALDDQQLAGLILWVPANLPFLGVALWRLLRGLNAKAGATHGL